MNTSLACRVLTPLIFVTLSACETGNPFQPDTSAAPLDPVWISASWGGGSVLPMDRTNREPSEFRGQLCPSETVILESYTASATNRPGQVFGEGLLIWNKCTIINTVGICVRKGSFAQPSGNFQLKACATDPLQTPFLDLKVLTINPNKVLGLYIPTFGSPSLEVFYCGTQTALLAPPVAAKVSCSVIPGL